MTVGLVIVSHSARLAEGVAELAGQMAQGKTPIAPAGGAIGDVLGTSVDKIVEAIGSVDSPDGVLVLLDLGSAILSAEMALELLDDEIRSHTRLSFAPLVEGAVAAALESSLGRTLLQVQQAAEKTASADQLQLLKPLSQDEETQSITRAEESKSPILHASEAPEIQLALTNPAGLHARPASLFVQTAARFSSTVKVLDRGKEADAASIMSVLSLGARQGDTITIRASGSDANEAIAALSNLVRANFYEETPPESSTESQPAATTPTVPALPVGAGVSRPAPMYRPNGGSAPTPREPWHVIPTSPGVALGPALLYTSGSISLSSVERRTIAPEQVGPERQRLREALSSAAQELNAMAVNLQSSVGPAQAAIFTAQALMLRDPLLLESTLQMVDEQHSDAAGALAAIGERQASTLESLDDPLLAARAVDMRDAVSRAIQHLGSQLAPKQDLESLKRPVILVARDLTPSDTAHLRPATVLGICTAQGGPTAHAAIIARSLGIPAVAGLDGTALEIIHNGDELGLDADRGLLYHSPAPEIRAQLAERIAERQEQQAKMRSAAQQAQEPVLLNGRRILLLANIGSEAEAEAARQWGAEGIGLLRTEFLYAGATTLPTEDEQRQRYTQVFRAFAGADAAAGPIVVRTLDAGADKPMPALEAVIGPMSEENPALGVRGLRIHLVHQVLLEQQISALLLAAAETGIELQIMFPMVTAVEELQLARSIFDRVYQRLKDRQVALPSRVPVGIMVEVPAAAMMAAELAEVADFFSIGSNDLAQYTLASDRTNSNLSNLYNPMQPAVLRLISQVAGVGRRAGKPVVVCGEMAGDVRLAPLLVALGVDELSMTPTAIPGVRAALSDWSLQTLSELAAKAMQAKTVSEVERVLARYESADGKG